MRQSNPSNVEIGRLTAIIKGTSERVLIRTCTRREAECGSNVAIGGMNDWASFKSHRWFRKSESRVHEVGYLTGFSTGSTTRSVIRKCSRREAMSGNNTIQGGIANWKDFRFHKWFPIVEMLETPST